MNFIYTGSYQKYAAIIAENPETAYYLVVHFSSWLCIKFKQYIFSPTESENLPSSQASDRSNIHTKILRECPGK